MEALRDVLTSPAWVPQDGVPSYSSARPAKEWPSSWVTMSGPAEWPAEYTARAPPHPP